MRCRSCNGESRIRKVSADDATVTRWRSCDRCGRRWRTIECYETQDAMVEAFKGIKNKVRATA